MIAAAEQKKTESIREVTRHNLSRIMAEERIDAAELARRYGSTRQNIQGFIEQGFGEKVVEQMAKALNRPWYDFYKIDFKLADVSGVPNDIIQVLLDVRKIMERGDESQKRLVVENVRFMIEAINQKEQAEMLEKRVKKLEEITGLDEDSSSGRQAGVARPPSHPRKRERKSG